MVDTFTYLIADNVGKLRLAIADIDMTTTTGTRDTWTALFTDEGLKVFLVYASNNIYEAASYALYSMASSRALTAKVKRLVDFSEDLSKIADSLRAQAKAYKEQALSDPAGGFAEMALTDFSMRTIIRREDMRSG